MPSWSLHFDIYGTALCTIIFKIFNRSILDRKTWRSLENAIPENFGHPVTCSNKSIVKHTWKWGNLPSKYIELKTFFFSNKFSSRNTKHRLKHKRLLRKQQKKAVLLWSEIKYTNNEYMTVLGSSIMKYICIWVLRQKVLVNWNTVGGRQNGLERGGSPTLCYKVFFLLYLQTSVIVKDKLKINTMSLKYLAASNILYSQQT